MSDRNEILAKVIAKVIIDQGLFPLPGTTNGVISTDPFNESCIIQRKDKPPMQAGQFQFYYYYHRPTGNMILRTARDTTIIENIETIGIDTWIVQHTEPPLKYLVSGYARRIYVKGNTAVLS